MNPLIEKFEEVYGKKPKEGGLIDKLADDPGMEKLKEVVSRAMSTSRNDVISFGDNDTVIPTAQKMPGGGINLTGDYIDSSVLNLNQAYVGTSIIGGNSYNRSVAVPHNTPVEQQFFKVLEDLGRGKATVAGISAEVDQSFTGFGGQIRYTVEIVGTYP